MSVAALNSALSAATTVLGQEIGLAGHSILASATGFAAARFDVEAKPSNAAFMQEARPVLEALVPELEAEGLEMAAVREALSHLDGDLDGGIEASLWMMKLADTLEGFSRHSTAFERAANRIWESERFVFHSGKHAAEAKKLYRYMQNREFLASLPPYSKRYRELGSVARGGQATIYLVAELDENGKETGRQFVSRKIHGAESTGRFYDYAKALQVLDHPNIVRLHEVTVDNGDFIIIMEIAPGQSLKAHLEHAPPLSAERIFNLRDQLLEALCYAWRCGVIHRDLKPTNIMMALNRLTGEMKLTLLDFGMAKFKAIDSRSSSMGKGTFVYWVPEQFEASKITEATDIYQMGLVLLDLVRGHSGQRGMRDKTILEKDPLEEVEELRALHGGDPAIQKVLDQIEVMCDRDPQKRLKILGMLGIPADGLPLADTHDEEAAEAAAEVEAIVRSSEIEVASEDLSNADISLSLALGLPAEISSASAMAMVDQRPPRWLANSVSLMPSTVGALGMSFIGGIGVWGGIAGVAVLGFVGGAFFLALPHLKPFRCSAEEVLKERTLKKLKSIIKKSEDEEMRLSAAKALIETDDWTAFTTFKKLLDNRETRKLAIWGLREAGPTIVATNREDLRWEFENYLLDKAAKWEQHELEWFLSALKKMWPEWAPLLTLLYSEKEDPTQYSKIPSSQPNERFLEKILKKGSILDEFKKLEQYRRAVKALGAMRRVESVGLLVEAFNRFLMFRGDIPDSQWNFCLKPLGDEMIQALANIGGHAAWDALEKIRLKVTSSTWSAKILAAQQQIRQAMK